MVKEAFIAFGSEQELIIRVFKKAGFISSSEMEIEDLNRGIEGMEIEEEPNAESIPLNIEEDEQPLFMDDGEDGVPSNSIEIPQNVQGNLHLIEEESMHFP